MVVSGRTRSYTFIVMCSLRAWWDVGTPWGKLKQLFFGKRKYAHQDNDSHEGTGQIATVSCHIRVMVNGFEWNFKGQLSSADHYIWAAQCQFTNIYFQKYNNSDVIMWDHMTPVTNYSVSSIHIKIRSVHPARENVFAWN